MKYIPSVSANIINLVKKKHKFYDKYSASWWEDDSFFNYPYVMMSAYHHINVDVRKKYNISRKYTIFLDSGGYSNYAKDIGLKPISVLDWQQTNGSIGFSYDFPLSKHVYGMDVDKRLKTNIENINFAVKNRKKCDMKFYACTHAWSRHQLLDYHEKLSKKGIDGLGIGQVSSGDDNIQGIIERIALEGYLNKNKKPMHLLGVGALLTLGFVALFERKTGIEITYDSTNYSYLGRFKKYKQKWKDVYTNNISKLTCDCPVCQIADLKDMRKMDITGTTLRDLHNIYESIKLNNELNNIAKDDMEGVFNYIRRNISKKNFFEWRAVVEPIFSDFIRTPLSEFVKDYEYVNKYFFKNYYSELRKLPEKTTKTKKIVVDLKDNKFKNISILQKKILAILYEYENIDTHDLVLKLIFSYGQDTIGTSYRSLVKRGLLIRNDGKKQGYIKKLGITDFGKTYVESKLLLDNITGFLIEKTQINKVIDIIKKNKLVTHIQFFIETDELVIKLLNRLEEVIDIIKPNFLNINGETDMKFKFGIIKNVQDALKLDKKFYMKTGKIYRFTLMYNEFWMERMTPAPTMIYHLGKEI
jgi:queuine/archaeosine tRNA-ribosyltransferase